MSKIEKALDRAKQNRGMALVRSPGKAQPETPQDDQRNRSGSNSGQRAIARKSSANSIARMKESELRTGKELASVQVISPDNGNNPTVQAFREMRTRILQHTKGQNGVILVTSAAGGSGGSFIARNLAVAFAFDSGHTSLLVDCNLSDPNLQFLLNGKGAKGITDYLEDDQLSTGDIIHPVGIERLRLIPAGTGHFTAAEYFMSDRARQFFSEIRDRYSERIVILDAPPMLESADAQIMAEMSDYVLLVVPYAKLTNVQIDNCIKSIDPKKFIGIVFNDEPLLPPIQLNATGIWRLLTRNLKETLMQMRDALLQPIKRK